MRRFIIPPGAQPYEFLVATSTFESARCHMRSIVGRGTRRVVARSVGVLGPFMKRLSPQAISLPTNRKSRGQINRSSDNEHHLSAMHSLSPTFNPRFLVLWTVELVMRKPLGGRGRVASRPKRLSAERAQSDAKPFAVLSSFHSCPSDRSEVLSVMARYWRILCLLIFGVVRGYFTDLRLQYYPPLMVCIDNCNNSVVSIGRTAKQKAVHSIVRSHTVSRQFSIALSH
jgi:hypothetical protein